MNKIKVIEALVCLPCIAAVNHCRESLLLNAFLGANRNISLADSVVKVFGIQKPKGKGKGEASRLITCWPDQNVVATVAQSEVGVEN